MLVQRQHWYPLSFQKSPLKTIAYKEFLMPITHVCTNRTYLQTVLFVVLSALHKKQRYSDIAAALNNLNLVSPIGKQWKMSQVKDLLKRIRSAGKYPSQFTKELSLCLSENVFTTSFAKPLIKEIA